MKAQRGLFFVLLGIHADNCVPSSAIVYMVACGNELKERGLLYFTASDFIPLAIKAWNDSTSAIQYPLAHHNGIDASYQD